MELQIVGPQGSEIMKVSDIKNYKKTVNVRIPNVVDRNGGIFEIDLGLWNSNHTVMIMRLIPTQVSIEDANGCKRNLSVPGISVNVRRIKASDLVLIRGATWLNPFSIANRKILHPKWEAAGHSGSTGRSQPSITTYWRKGQLIFESCL